MDGRTDRQTYGQVVISIDLHRYLLILVGRDRGEAGLGEDEGGGLALVD